MCAGLPPGAQPQMVSTGFVPGQRLSFAGLPTATSAAAAAARPVPPVSIQRRCSLTTLKLRM